MFCRLVGLSAAAASSETRVEEMIQRSRKLGLVTACRPAGRAVVLGGRRGESGKLLGGVGAQRSAARSRSLLIEVWHFLPHDVVITMILLKCRGRT